MKRFLRIIPILLAVALLTSCGKDKNEDDAQQVSNVEQGAEKIKYNIPEVEGLALDSKLQQDLMNEGYILSVKSEYSDEVAKGSIISQKPAAGDFLAERGLTLELTVSAGSESNVILEKPEDEKEEETKEEENKEEEIPKVQDPTDDGVPVPQWKGNIKWLRGASSEYSALDTFNNTGYSIYNVAGTYGIVDMNGNGVGTGNYTKIDYCPAHGVVCPDVAESTQIAEDLTLAPACGCDIDSYYGTVYVYDNTRSKIYMTGYANGEFRITDITDTDIVKNTAQFPSVLYNCDADLMMYDQSGIESLQEVFTAENREMAYGVVNNKMEIVVGYIYQDIEYANDCYIVKKNGKYGYRGTAGQHYYPCIFEDANTAYLGAAWVKYNGKWGTVAF